MVVPRWGASRAATACVRRSPRSTGATSRHRHDPDRHLVRVWHVGGDHPLSGDYRGRDALFQYVGKVLELTGGTLTAEPLDILVNDRHAGVFQRVTGERDGRKLDVVLAQALTFDDDGRWSEYWALADQQDEVDAFWAGAT